MDGGFSDHPRPTFHEFVFSRKKNGHICVIPRHIAHCLQVFPNGQKGKEKLQKRWTRFLLRCRCFKKKLWPQFALCYLIMWVKLCINGWLRGRNSPKSFDRAVSAASEWRRKVFQEDKKDVISVVVRSITEGHDSALCFPLLLSFRLIVGTRMGFTTSTSWPTACCFPSLISGLFPAFFNIKFNI